MTYQVQRRLNNGAWDTTTEHQTLDDAHARIRSLYAYALYAHAAHSKADPSLYRVVDERGHVRHV